MRRKDRLCMDKEFLEGVLEKAEVIFISVYGDDFPYCFPVNFAKHHNSLYIHCAQSGYKLDCIAANNHVSFSCATDMEIDLAKSTTYYKSVCGKALAYLISDIKEKQLALDAITRHYHALCRYPAPEADAARVGILRLDIVEMTGKCHIKNPI